MNKKTYLSHVGRPQRRSSSTDRRFRLKNRPLQGAVEPYEALPPAPSAARPRLVPVRSPAPERQRAADQSSRVDPAASG